MNIKLVSYITMAIVGAASAALIVLDIVWATDKLPHNTISAITLDTSRKHPILPLLVGLVLGILFGHLFWPQKR